MGDYRQQASEIAGRRILERLAKGPANDIELARAMYISVLDTGFARRSVRSHTLRMEEQGIVVGRPVGKAMMEWSLVG